MAIEDSLDSTQSEDWKNDTNLISHYYIEGSSMVKDQPNHTKD